MVHDSFVDRSLTANAFGRQHKINKLIISGRIAESLFENEKKKKKSCPNDVTIALSSDWGIKEFLFCLTNCFHLPGNVLGASYKVCVMFVCEPNLPRCVSMFKISS